MDEIRRLLKTLPLPPSLEPLTDDRIDALLTLTYPDGVPLLSLEQRGVLVEIGALLQKRPWETVWEYLQQVPDPDSLVLNSPLLEDTRKEVMHQRELSLQDPPSVKLLGKKCYRCGGNNFLISEVQTRSADEGQTVFYHCIDCGNTMRG